VLEGEDANARLLDDIYHSLKDQGGEVLIAGLAEQTQEDKEAVGRLDRHLERLKRSKISERILIEEGDTNFVAPAHWYKWLPKGYFSGIPFQAYGSKVALIDWGPPQEILVIDHEKFAHAFGTLFDVVWNLAAVPAEDDRS